MKVLRQLFASILALSGSLSASSKGVDAFRHGDLSDNRQEPKKNHLRSIDNGHHDHDHQQQHRHLQLGPGAVNITGDTSTGMIPGRNPTTSCDMTTACINHCKSQFYTIVGTGSDILINSCGDSTTFQSAIYVWSGDSCANFQCASVNVYGFCSGATDSAGRVAFSTEAGVNYRIQVTGTSSEQYGAFALDIYGTDVAPVPYTVDNCDPTPSPTKSPTAVTSTPTALPTNVPTKVPTAPPSRAPVIAPCNSTVGTTYWVYDPITNAPLRQLFNNTIVCLKDPYNLEVRPASCSNIPPNGSSVTIQLVRKSDGVVVHASKPQRSAPYFLFGPSNSKGDVLPNPKALPSGQYRLLTKEYPAWGKVTFTQDCSCPKGKKGVPGCRR